MFDKVADLPAIARDIRLNHRRPDSFAMSEIVEECQTAELNTVAIIPVLNEKGQGSQRLKNTVNETDKETNTATSLTVRRNIFGAKDLGFISASTNRRNVHHKNMPVILTPP